MDIIRNKDGATLTISVVGRLDTNTAPELEAEMKLDDAEELVFDLVGLEYISSAGLRVLMGAQKTMSARGGKMKVVNANAMVRGVFDITGLSGIFLVE